MHGADLQFLEKTPLITVDLVPQPNVSFRDLRHIEDQADNFGNKFT